MKKKTNESPFINFLESIMHLGHLNEIQKRNLVSYEGMQKATQNAKKVLAEIKGSVAPPETEEEKTWKAERITLIQSEIKSDFYTIKSSELILVFSRLECAVSDFVSMYFATCDIKKLPPVAVKAQIFEYAKLKKSDQRQYLADAYMAQMTEGVKYGFKRFESMLRPILGESALDKELQNQIFKLSQIRNLLIHKNGVVDRQCLGLLGLSSKMLNKQISLTDNLMKDLLISAIDYASDIISRIKSLDKIGKNNISRKSKKRES